MKAMKTKEFWDLKIKCKDLSNNHENVDTNRDTLEAISSATFNYYNNHKTKEQ